MKRSLPAPSVKIAKKEPELKTFNEEPRGVYVKKGGGGESLAETER